MRMPMYTNEWIEFKTLVWLKICLANNKDKKQRK